jgi:hypothetical protein
MVSGFCRDLDYMYPLLGYYEGKEVQKLFFTLEDGTDRFPETSV